MYGETHELNPFHNPSNPFTQDLQESNENGEMANTSFIGQDYDQGYQQSGGYR